MTVPSAWDAFQEVTNSVETERESEFSAHGLTSICKRADKETPLILSPLIIS
jgi:hypothetical protein